MAERRATEEYSDNLAKELREGGGMDKPALPPSSVQHETRRALRLQDELISANPHAGHWKTLKNPLPLTATFALPGASRSEHAATNLKFQRWSLWESQRSAPVTTTATTNEPFAPRSPEAQQSARRTAGSLFDSTSVGRSMRRVVSALFFKDNAQASGGFPPTHSAAEEPLSPSLVTRLRGLALWGEKTRGGTQAPVRSGMQEGAPVEGPLLSLPEGAVPAGGNRQQLGDIAVLGSGRSYRREKPARQEVVSTLPGGSEKATEVNESSNKSRMAGKASAGDSTRLRLGGMFSKRSTPKASGISKADASSEQQQPAPLDGHPLKAGNLGVFQGGSSGVRTFVRPGAGPPVRDGLVRGKVQREGDNSLLRKTPVTVDQDVRSRSLGRTKLSRKAPVKANGRERTFMRYRTPAEEPQLRPKSLTPIKVEDMWTEKPRVSEHSGKKSLTRHRRKSSTVTEPQEEPSEIFKPVNSEAAQASKSNSSRSQRSNARVQKNSGRDRASENSSRRKAATTGLSDAEMLQSTRASKNKALPRHPPVRHPSESPIA